MTIYVVRTCLQSRQHFWKPTSSFSPVFHTQHIEAALNIRRGGSEEAGERKRERAESCDANNRVYIPVLHNYTVDHKMRANVASASVYQPMPAAASGGNWDSPGNISHLHGGSFGNREDSISITHYDEIKIDHPFLLSIYNDTGAVGGAPTCSAAAHKPPYDCIQAEAGLSGHEGEATAGPGRQRTGSGGGAAAAAAAAAALQ
jgi:hypothetical protein